MHIFVTQIWTLTLNVFFTDSDCIDLQPGGVCSSHLSVIPNTAEKC